MNLLRHFFSRAFNGNASRLRSNLRAAEAAYTLAKATYGQAWDRGDCRSVGQAWRNMHLARNAALAAELALRAAQPRRTSYSAKPASTGGSST